MDVGEKGQENSEIVKLKECLAELEQKKTQLQKSEELYRLLAENSMDAIWRLDDRLQFTYVSPNTKNIIGFEKDEIIGRSLFSILTPESSDIVQKGYAARSALQAEKQTWGSATYTVEAIHKDGHHVWVEVAVNPIFDADHQLIGYNGVSRDITERRKIEELIRCYAFRDPLTNLPNRRMFEEVLERSVEQNRQSDQPFAVMFLDIDGLKKVNDRYGHAFGDALLQVTAERFCHALRKEDFVARLAGDEFMAILPGIGDDCSVGLIANRLIESCRQPIAIGSETVTIGVSVGVSFFPADADNVVALMNYADHAMYRAKETGGAGYVCYSQ